MMGSLPDQDCLLGRPCLPLAHVWIVHPAENCLHLGLVADTHDLKK